jgi:hypothetical protein
VADYDVGRFDIPMHDPFLMGVMDRHAGLAGRDWLAVRPCYHVWLAPISNRYWIARVEGGLSTSPTPSSNNPNFGRHISAEKPLSSPNRPLPVSAIRTRRI